MNTYFVRHTKKLSIDRITLERLWDERRIAIHFPHDKSGKRPSNRDNISLDPKDYKRTDAQAIATFVELAQNGGYVCAQYRWHESECLVGVVNPKTDKEFVKGKWGDKNSRQAIYKSVTLQKWKVIPVSELAITLVGRPRQGTIRRWPSAGDRIKNLVEGKTSNPKLQSLLPYQQEIMCSEFLRLPEAEKQGLPRMAHLLLREGRTMKTIDICGISVEGQLIFAQVTFGRINKAETETKLHLLSEYKSNNEIKLILFCDCEHPDTRDNVLIYPLKRVFDLFTSTATGQKWLERTFS